MPPRVPRRGPQSPPDPIPPIDLTRRWESGALKGWVESVNVWIEGEQVGRISLDERGAPVIEGDEARIRARFLEQPVTGCYGGDVVTTVYTDGQRWLDHAPFYYKFGTPFFSGLEAVRREVEV